MKSILDVALFNRIRNNARLNKCRKCSAPFEQGEVIVSLRTYNTKYYHKECAEKINIWMSELEEVNNG